MENPNTYYRTMHAEKYHEMFLPLIGGGINQSEWKLFCDDMLEHILKENKDVLVRLEFR
jgi:hypothetical protein